MKDTRTLVEISLLVALAFVLDVVSGFIFRFFWPQGGSISLSLVPMAMIAYRHGTKNGVMAGIVYGTISMMNATFALIHVMRVLFDFYLPMIGASVILGFWSKKIADAQGSIGLSVWISIGLASFLRFVSHWLSGIFFFYMFAPDGMNVNLYSFVYNFPQQFFNWLLCAPLLVVLLKRYDFAKVTWKKAV